MTVPSLFSNVSEGPVDPMYDLKVQLEGDQSPYKIDLGAGVYRDEKGGYYELPVLKKVAMTVSFQTKKKYRLTGCIRQN